MRRCACTAVALLISGLAVGAESIYHGDFWKSEGALYGDGRVPSADHLKTPDKAPHGHRLNYRIEVPQSGWYALFFKGNAPRQDYFVDDTLVAYDAEAGNKPGDGYCQGPSIWLEKGSRVIRLERLGRRGFPMQKFESFELRPLEGADRTYARVKGHDVVRLGETLKVELKSSAAGSSYEIQYALQEEAGKKDAWTTSGTVSIGEGVGPKTYVAEVKLPCEGMYFLRALVSGKEVSRNVFPRMQVVAIDVKDHGSETADFKLKTVVDIDCVTQAPDAEANGETRVTKNEKYGLAYRESHDCSKVTAEPFDGNASENLSGFSYAVKVPEAQVPYLLEVEFPDDARRSVCVYHAWCQEGTNLYLKSNHGYQTKSWETGGFFPISNTMKCQQQIIWPLSTEGKICILNMSAGTRAACARIRLSRFEGDLPPARGKAVKGGRTFAYWSEEGNSFAIMLGAGPGAEVNKRKISYLEAARRWFQMIRFYGGNAMSGVGVAYQGAYWKTRALKGFGVPEYSQLRLFALLAEKYNMRFIPEIFSNQGFMHDVLITEAVGRESALAKNASGSLAGGGVNALCPLVQDTYVKMMEEIAAEIGDSPAFKGVTVRADPWQFQGQFFFKSLYWGYNECNVRAFEKETGIKVPAGTATDYFHFLTKPDMKDKWIAWRCAKIGDYQNLLLKVLRGNGKRDDLFFGMAGQFDQENLYQREETLQERALGCGVDVKACGESDGLSIIPISRYGSRTPSVESRRIYDEFFRTDSIAGGLCTPRAFAGYMTYMELGHGWPAEKLGLDLSLRGGNKPYECSGVVAAGRLGLEKYAVVLAEQDTAYFREGGNADCLGSAEVFGPWFAEFSRIPAVKFDKAAGLNDPVAVWHKDVDGTYWYYIVNKESFATTVTVRFSDGKSITHEVEPFGLHAFSEKSARRIVAAESVYPETARREVRTLLAKAQAMSKDVKSIAYDEGLAKAWSAAEAGKWWRARVELNMAPMYSGYQRMGAIPAEVLRTTFPDKLDLQNPKNGHWELCTPSIPVALVDFDKGSATMKPSSEINSEWRGDSVIWSETGSVTLTLDVPAEGLYDLELGLVAAKPGSVVVAADGRILDGTGRINVGGEPVSAFYRRIPLKPGKVKVSVSTREAMGIYGLKFLPVMRPIPGSDWVVADKFDKFWGTLDEGGYEHDLIDKGIADLQSKDLSNLHWNYEPEGVHDILWDRGVQMPLRVSSAGRDRIISRTTIVSDRDRTATLIIAVDWWACVTLNGEVVKTDVVDCTSKMANFWGWYPMFTGIVNLKKGANELVAYQNGGSLGSALVGWISEGDDILTTAHNPFVEQKISNGQIEAVVTPALGGRVVRFGKVGGPNRLWYDSKASEHPGDKGWLNHGGEKTWVGKMSSGWNELYGPGSAWPPPVWFDSQAHSVEKVFPDRFEMRSRTSPGDVWNVDLYRSVFLKGDALVVRSRLKQKSPSSIGDEMKWNWSVTQIPEAKRLLFHQTGRKRTLFGRERSPLPTTERIGDYAVAEFETFGQNGLCNLDADVLCAEYDDGWMVIRGHRSKESVENFERPAAAVFRSGLPNGSKDPSRMYIELEFLAYGHNTEMVVEMRYLPKMTASDLVDVLEREANPRIDAMRNDKLGMFIHWGVYSVPAKGEWLMFRDKIPAAEYNKYADQFRQPDSFSPREWVRLAKRMGAKYAVLTTRHHDGFCLFDTKTTDFNSVKTAAKRDYVREFVEACRAEGIRIGLYYSIMNWQFDHSPNGVFDQKVWDAQVACTHEALRELMTNYGKIDYLWYDGCCAPGSTDAITMERMWRIKDMNEMVRRLQPDILINDRSATPQDYSTPEQSLAAPPRGRMWESCMTCNGMWGYKADDNDWKSSDTLFRSLLHCARFGGNLLINIGPRADGSVPEECVRSLEGLGKLIARCPEAIYGAVRDDYTEATHEAGVVTKANGSYWLWALNSDRLDGVEKSVKVGEGVYRITRKTGSVPCNWLGGRHDVPLKSGDAPVLGDDSGRETPPSGVVEPLNLPEATTVAFDLPAGGSWKLEVGYVNKDGFKDTYTKIVETASAGAVQVKLPSGKGIYARRFSPQWKPVDPKSWTVAGTFKSRFYELKWSEEGVKEVYAKDLLAEAATTRFVPVSDEIDKADKCEVRLNHNFSDPQKEIGYAFARRTFTSETDRTVYAALGIDWWGKVYINGQLALDYCSGWKPKPFPLHLKKGDNEVLVITHGGSRQHWFTFYTNEGK